MAKVTVTEDSLVVDMEGLDKIWALKSQLTIPLTSVRGATVGPGVAKERSGWRGPGT
jgi:hypothetical protein